MAQPKKLEYSGPAEKERVASVPQRESSWQVHYVRFFQKGKEQSCLSRATDREVGESQDEREPHLWEREVIRGGA